MSEVTEQVQTDTLSTGRFTSKVHQAGAGNSEAVMFLHGSGPGATSWSNWQFALPALGVERHCIAADIVGFGATEHPEDPPSGMAAWMDLWTDQAIEILDHLDIERAHVVGNSMGGAIAQHLLHRHPDRFDRAILMGTVGPKFEITELLDLIWGFYDEPTVERMEEALPWFAYDQSIMGDNLKSIAAERVAATEVPEVRRSYEAMFPAPRQRHLDDLALTDEEYAAIEHPTLLIAGRDDVIIPLEVSTFLLEHLARPQLHVFSRCRHWVQIEYRDAFHTLVGDFLDGDL